MSAGINERFEIKAEVFYRMTGHLAPGKDAPTIRGEATEETRLALWELWNKIYRLAVEATMEACGKELKS